MAEREAIKKEWHQKWWGYFFILLVLPATMWVILDLLLPSFFKLLNLEIVEMLTTRIELTLSILVGIVTKIEIKRWSAKKSFERKTEPLERLSKFLEEIPVPFAFGFQNRLTKNGLNHVQKILGYSTGDKYQPFWANIYLMRSMSPAMILNKKEDSFLFLLRGVEEARAIPGPKGDKAIRDNFERIQEEDYRLLFTMVNTSYYVTSYGDHDVWVIGERGDLEYYLDNYRRDRELKVSKIKALPIGDKEIQLSPGIHRAFILPSPLIDINAEAVKKFVNGFKDIIKKEHGKYNISELPAEWNVKKNEFKSNSNVQFVSVLLAAKIHQKLGTDFAIVPIEEDIQTVDKNMKERLEVLSVLPKADEFLEEWENLGWKRLGSALFDDVIYAYAERIPSTEEKAIVYYRFDKDDPHKFAEEMFCLISENKGFSKIKQQYKPILKILDPPAKEFAKIIKKMGGI